TLDARRQMLRQLRADGWRELTVEVARKQLGSALVIHDQPDRGFAPLLFKVRPRDASGRFESPSSDRQRVRRARYSLIVMRARCKRDLMVPSARPVTSPSSSYDSSSTSRKMIK